MISRPDITLVSIETKACNKSWVQQLTLFDSWTLTARILLSKVFFTLTKGPDVTLDCVVFNKNEIYLPISLIGKLSFDFGLLSKTKFNLEDWYLNIKQGIFILFEKYTI